MTFIVDNKQIEEIQIKEKPFIEKEKIIEIWKKGDFKLVRQKLSKQEYILDVCKKCVSAHNNQT